MLKELVAGAISLLWVRFIIEGRRKKIVQELENDEKWASAATHSHDITAYFLRLHKKLTTSS